MDDVELQTALINNINDKNEILNKLADFYDEDFNGNNGKEYTRDDAIKNGFSSTQDFVIDTLRKSDLTGEKLIRKYFDEWIGKDGYYTNYTLNIDEYDGKYVIALAYVYGY